nr:hypothetical protein [Pandoravirus belohorizontensis]
MERATQRASLGLRRRPRKRSRLDVRDEVGLPVAAETPSELPGEIWHSVLSQLGTAEALGLGGVSQTFEAGRRATLNREIAQARRQLCPDPLACTRALVCAIANDDIDAVAAILSTGVVRADTPAVRHPGDIDNVFAGAPCTIDFLAPGVAMYRPGRDQIFRDIELTPLALAVILGSPRTVGLLASHGVRPWPTVEALVDLALASPWSLMDIAVTNRGDAQDRFVKERPATDVARALVAGYRRTLPVLSPVDTHPLDVLREAILNDVHLSVAADPSLPGVLRDLNTLLLTTQSTPDKPATVAALRAFVPRGSAAPLGSVISDLMRAQVADRGGRMMTAIESIIDKMAVEQGWPEMTDEEIEAMLSREGSVPPGAPADGMAGATKESFDSVVDRIVEDSARRLDWPALIADLLAAGYGPDDDHVPLGALLNAAPGAAETVLRTPRKRTVARLRGLYDMPLYEPRWVIDAAVQIKALERLLALFGDADQEQELE